MKKLINEVDNVVNEMLDGIAAAYPQHVRRLDGLDVLVRALIIQLHTAFL